MTTIGLEALKHTLRVLSEALAPTDMVSVVLFDDAAYEVQREQAITRNH